jgi:hypothetical protein
MRDKEEAVKTQESTIRALREVEARYRKEVEGLKAQIADHAKT